MSIETDFYNWSSGDSIPNTSDSTLYPGGQYSPEAVAAEQEFWRNNPQVGYSGESGNSDFFLNPAENNYRTEYIYGPPTNYGHAGFIPGGNYTKDSWFGVGKPRPDAPPDYDLINSVNANDTLYDPYATSETLPWQAEQEQAAMMYPETAGDQSWMNEYPLDNMSYLLPAGGFAGMSRIKSGSASKMAERGGSGKISGNAYAGLTQAQAAKAAQLKLWKEQQLARSRLLGMKTIFKK